MKVFVETQKMNQLWIKAVLGIVLIITIIPIFKDWNYISHQSISSKLSSFSGPAILLLVFIFINKITLKTRIDEQGISYQFFPIHWTYKSITWNEIETASIRRYNAIMEYGGWGIRLGFLRRNGMALTTRGTIGLQLELKNGKKILIGTHNEEDLKQTLLTYQNKLT